MSRVIRVSDETAARWEPWMERNQTADRLVSRILDAAELGTVECGLCGARAPFTDKVTDTWYPDVWAVHPDGREPARNIRVVPDAGGVCQQVK